MLCIACRKYLAHRPQLGDSMDDIDKRVGGHLLVSNRIVLTIDYQ